MVMLYWLASSQPDVWGVVDTAKSVINHLGMDDFILYHCLKDTEDLED